MAGLKTTLLVCCHKQDVYAKQAPYFPIQVGKALSTIDLGIQGDDTGDNISRKNASYCELTGMYWAWKNLGDSDIIGLCHYRRYFDFHKQGRFGFPSTSLKSRAFDGLDLSIPEEYLERVKNGAIILTKPKVYRNPVFVDYCVRHISDDIRTLRTIINTTQPEYIQEAFFKVVEQDNRLRHYNMFIMRRDMFDQYCSWLFPLLETVENNIDISSYNPVQKRIFGYMSERLLSVWAVAHRLKIIEKPVLWINDGEDYLNGYTFPRYALRVVTNTIANFMVKPRR